MEKIEETARRLKESRRSVAFTGAGISAESGIPTFRGSQGLWTKYDPAEYAEIGAFLKNPAKVWAMLKEMTELIMESQPNAAHKALAELEEMGYLKGVITQNVDNLHQRAGSQRVIEYHGNGEQFYCLNCGTRFRASELSIESLPPLCPCSGVLRPDVVFFGEPIPVGALLAAEEEARDCDLMLVVGTSAIVYPAAQLPFLAKAAGATIVEINPEATPLTGTVSDFIIRGSAGVILPAIVEQVLKLEGGRGAQKDGGQTPP